MEDGKIKTEEERMQEIEAVEACKMYERFYESGTAV